MRGPALLFALAFALPAQAQDAEIGQDLFLSYCSACHGPAGQGDGPMAEVLTVAPPDLRQIAARNGGVFPVLGVAAQIDGRDPLLAHGGEMPIFGRWFATEGEVALAEPSGQPVLMANSIADLVSYLMEIQE